MLRYELIQTKRKVSWLYEYPTINGEVSNDAIAKFQAWICNLESAITNGVPNTNGCVDFKRNYRINGRNYPSDTDTSFIERDIYNLVNDCEGYGDDIHARKLLAEWLLSRGGQNHNTFVESLVINNHFYIDSRYKCVGAWHQEATITNWSKNKHGKVEFHYSVDVSSMQVAVQDREEESFTILRNDMDDIDFYAHTTEDNERAQAKLGAGASPLMRIEARIQLEIRNGAVFPVFKRITVNGFSDRIRVNRMNLINRKDTRSLRALVILKKLEETNAYCFGNMSVRNQFHKVTRMIENSNFGTHIESLNRACEYIERITCSVEGLFSFCPASLVPMAVMFRNNAEFNKIYPERFKEHPRLDTVKPNNNQAPHVLHPGRYPLEDIVDVFRSIYMELKLLIRIFNPISTFRYNAAAPGNYIEAEFIREWREELVQSNAANNMAFEDFRHGYKINGELFTANSSNDEISSAIKKLTRYAKDCSAQDKEALYQWIASRGGQQHESFMLFLFEHKQLALNFFPEEIPDPDTTVLLPDPNPDKTKILESEWYLENDGSICLSYVFQINSLYCCYSGTPANGEEARIKRNVSRNHHTNELIFEPSDMQSANSGNFPLLRIEAKIALNVVNGRVVPNMESLNITSYSSNLTLARVAREQQVEPIQSTSFRF